MKHLLVGVDGSPGSLQAMQWASLLAKQTNADVTLACVVVAPQIEMTPGTTARQRVELEARAENEWCPVVRDAGVSCASAVLEDDPADALLRAVRDTEVDLLVLGARGAGGFNGLRLGSVADHVAHHTTQPLAIVPEATTSPQLRSIIVGADGSDGGGAAVRWAAEFAGASGAEVTAVYVFSRLAEFWGHDDPRSPFVKSQALLDEVWAEPLRQTGTLRATRVIEDPHTAEGLITAADEAGADLLVVGTRSLGGIFHLRLGGVTMQLLHRSDLPVLIVPPRPA
jgi:nucleotide-binding universal stress UspA family protein